MREVPKLLTDASKLKDSAVKFAEIMQEVDVVINNQELLMNQSPSGSAYLEMYKDLKKDIEKFTKLVSEMGELFITTHRIYEDIDIELVNRFRE